MNEKLEPGDAQQVYQPLSGRMRAAVANSVNSADHLAFADEADIELAYQLADIIDAARDGGSQAAIDKTSFGPMPTLHKVLTSLGLNPEGRQKLGMLDDEDDEEDF